jgi:hypothetical protein
VADFRHELTNNRTVVKLADWDCLDNCYGCIFKLKDVQVGSCHEYTEGVQVWKITLR